MPVHTELSSHLLTQWKQGEEDSITELFGRYELRLVSLVRSRIASQFKSRIDSHAIVNSTFREFLSKVEHDKFIPQKSGSIWSYLAAIARNKVAKQIEHHRAAKRNRDSEAVDSDELICSPEFIDREPDVSEELALMDELEHFMIPMNSIQRQILVFRLEGQSIEQIADNVERAESYVRGFLRKTGEKLEARLKSSL